MRTLLLSDLHIGAAGRYTTFGSAPDLINLLTHLSSAGPLRVFLNGDAFDFLLDADREPPADIPTVLAHARAILADNAPVLCAFGRVLDQGELVIRLGNHDVELALAEVQALFREAMVGERPSRAERLSFVRGDWPSLIRVGEATLLVTHGEHKDPANRVRYGALPGPGGPQNTTWADFNFPPGSMLVRRGLNPLKERGLRFADLVKPDFQGGFFAAAAVDPQGVRQVLAQSGLAVGLAFIRASFHPRTFADEGAQDLGLTERLRVLDLTDGELAALDDALSGKPAGEALVRAAAGALRRLAQAHRWVAGQHGEAFFSLAPADDEREEVQRLARKFQVRAVIQGHTHAARWSCDEGLVYANTGTWMPLVQLPPPSDGSEENLRLWQRFIQDLRLDPEMKDRAAARLTHLRSFVLAEPTPSGARLSLCEWRDGAVLVLSRDNTVCQAEIPAVQPRNERPRRAPSLAAGRVWSLLEGEDGRPWLPDGLPLQRIDPRTAPRPAGLVEIEASRRSYAVLGADQNGLFQGWGLVVPRGQRGRVDWIRPLYDHRATSPDLAGFVHIWEQLRARGDHRSQSALEALPIIEVDAAKTATPQGALTWARQNIADLRGNSGPLAGDRALPLYLLLLGDLHEIPLTIERALASEGLLPGRLAFSGADGKPDPDSYRSYASKLVRYERVPLLESKVPALFYAPSGEGDAVAVGDESVLNPTLQALGDGKATWSPYSRVRRIEDSFLPDPGSLLDDPDMARASVLMSVSHGRLANRGAPARQLRLQGAMSFGYHVEPLSADVLAEHLRVRPFLPGGIWFYIACFGAGTPSNSAYAPWLRQLEEGGELAADSLRGLAMERPFVAALPQVALASPDGPVAVIGHMDLAWTFGMEDHGAGAEGKGGRLTGDRFGGVIRALGTSPVGVGETGIWGAGRGGPQRVGVAFGRMLDEQRTYGANVSSLAAASATAAVKDLAYPEAWLCYQDVGGYCVLGDPAASLNLSERRAAAVSHPTVSSPAAQTPGDVAEALVAQARAELIEGRPGLGARYSEGGRAALVQAGVEDPEIKERALLAYARGDTEALAASHVSPVLLDALARLYERGGREAVAGAGVAGLAKRET